MRSLPLLFLSFATRDHNSPTPTENAIALCLVAEGDRFFELTKSQVHSTHITLQADSSTPSPVAALNLLAHKVLSLNLGHSPNWFPHPNKCFRGLRP